MQELRFPRACPVFAVLAFMKLIWIAQVWKLSPREDKGLSQDLSMSHGEVESESMIPPPCLLGGQSPGLSYLPSLQAPQPSTCFWACTRTSAATTPAQRPLRRSSFLTAIIITKASTGEWPCPSRAGWELAGMASAPEEVCRAHGRKQLALAHTQLKFCKQGQSSVTLES